ncbi:MAG: hypothetical protein NTU41_07415 [Chloroflexi bacterium]|nr:hypothetical protein [Chloroflexota bacterium]
MDDIWNLQLGLQARQIAVPPGGGILEGVMLRATSAPVPREHGNDVTGA